MSKARFSVQAHSFRTGCGIMELPHCLLRKRPRLVRMSWTLIWVIFPSWEHMERGGFSLCISALVKAIIRTDFEVFSTTLNLRQLLQSSVNKTAPGEQQEPALPAQ